MDARDYSGSMYPPQEPGQDMGNMAYMVPPSQFGFANMYMDMNGYSAPAGHYPPYPMAIYAPTMDAMAHQQPHPPQPKKKMTFNKNANFKPNAFNNYIPMNANVPNISPGSSKSSEKGLEYRFEVGNATYFNSEALKESYPIYINTNFAEFSRAKSTMEELRKSYSNFKTATVANEPNSVTEETRESEPQREANGEPIPKTEVNSSKEVESISASEEKVEEKVLKSTEYQTSSDPTAPPRSNTASPTPTKSSVSPKPAQTLPVKSWSKLAAGSLGKPKQQLAVTNLASKKGKKYVPPSVKSPEPLGSVALRVCFDKNFTNHTLQSTKAKKLITELVPRGIYNKGSICFISSVLQLLIHCRSFVNLLNVIHTTTVSRTNSVSPLLNACMDVFKRFDRETIVNELNETRENSKTKSKSSNLNENIISIDPEPFYKSISTLPKFKDLTWGRQEDAEEFLTHMLDQLHEEFIGSINTLNSNDILNIFQSLQEDDQKVFFLKYISKYKSASFAEKPEQSLKALFEKYKQTNDLSDEEDKEWKEVSKKGKKSKNASKRITEVESSPISTIFGGQFRSVLDTPQNKESQSITYDPFQTIQLDISSPDVIDLESAFKKFSEQESIELKSSSGNDVEAKKHTCIDKLPQALLIQFKRFSFVSQSSKNDLSNYNSFNGRIEKIRKMVKYNHELTIPKESISPNLVSTSNSEESFKYYLSGVIYHHGVSPSGGHYTCDVYDKDLDKWYRIDDVNVDEIKNKEDILRSGDSASDSRTAYILLYEKSS
ncbi:mRNA-binding ubiquitin-specific protease UBP3 [Kluyveromyces lactis]|uniref:Ubiquitin carboxyl-terminal hydrolase n=1 Tax=Kluyveromyces lactis (strain ATCC 8585 / CBS 2359 / DSM 70799 / NBRC 1267 / NRRL Y-1140 / WM37) TaxID=284590 RepID=Q6CPZ5_KLULA|nr:uncharacterized protein KLLA0_E01013g [Kluyveromyces lactis]CAG99081.1 KLLA0E01013p [Kluyveromyces lactis]|eukprot:XP_453994.1 uncharacterized protein KLLA0_E01013g [Kluyveromyces lactis]